MGQKKQTEGNVYRETEATGSQQFEPGDIVALTPSAIRTSRIKKMTPQELYKLGHENRFLVMHAFNDSENGPCITLFPCCNRFVDRTESHEKKRCTGHPSVYFEKVDVQRASTKKGDKSASLKLPFLPWDVAAIDYDADEANPKLSVSLLGQKGQITGPWAALIKNIAETQKIF